MIPTIQTIIEDLLAGTIDKSQAINWLHAHADGSANELRDHFAGLAMQAYSSDALCRRTATQKEIAASSYLIADAMLAEREK